MRARLGYDLELKAYEWVRMLRCQPWWDSYEEARVALGDRATPELDGFHHLLRGIEMDKVRRLLLLLLLLLLGGVASCLCVFANRKGWVCCRGLTGVRVARCAARRGGGAGDARCKTATQTF